MRALKAEINESPWTELFWGRRPYDLSSTGKIGMKGITHCDEALNVYEVFRL